MEIIKSQRDIEGSTVASFDVELGDLPVLRRYSSRSRYPSYHDYNSNATMTVSKM